MMAAMLCRPRTTIVIAQYSKDWFPARLHQLFQHSHIITRIKSRLVGNEVAGQTHQVMSFLHPHVNGVADDVQRETKREAWRSDKCRM